MQVLWRVYGVQFVTQRGQYSTNGGLWLGESFRNSTGCLGALPSISRKTRD